VQAAIGVSQLLLADEGLSERQRMLVSRFQVSAERMLDLLNLSLDIHAMEGGVYPVVRESVDLARLCRDILAQAADRYGRRAEDLRLEVNGKLCDGTSNLHANVDSRLLRSALENLVQNALEADESGPVTVSLANGEGVVFSVRNQSQVPESMHRTFFEKYATEGKGTGTGLGTYAVRLVAEMHGGSAQMESSREQGTVVSVRLPKQPPSAA